jgi:hypothetical protein
MLIEPSQRWNRQKCVRQLGSFGCAGPAVQAGRTLKASGTRRESSGIRCCPVLTVLQDDQFLLEVLSRNVEKPGTRHNVGGSLPGGSSYTITNEESYSETVETSFSAEATFFEVFSAGASTSFSSTHEVSNSKGLTINIDCEGQSGQLYWAPRFDHYTGTFQPSGDFAEV